MLSRRSSPEEAKRSHLLVELLCKLDDISVGLQVCIACHDKSVVHICRRVDKLLRLFQQWLGPVEDIQ